MMLNVGSLIGIIVFFLLMVVFGIVVTWKTRNKGGSNGRAQAIMIANKDIGMVVGTFTFAATWVGAAYFFGTAEQIYNPAYGLVWTVAPFCYAISLPISGFVFAPKLREKGFTTVLDPIENKLGRGVVVIFYIVNTLGDLFWLSAILGSFGAAISVVTGIQSTAAAIAIAAFFSVLYTMLGGLYAVAYTDVLQFGLIIIGMLLVVPFVLTNEAVGSITETAYQNENGTSPNWLGTWDPNTAGTWIDTVLFIILGAQGYQGLFQRVFAMKTLKKAQISLTLSAVFFLVLGIPAVLIGAAATNTDWAMLGYIDGVSNNNTPAENELAPIIFPLMIQLATPPVISFIGLGTISAAAISTADSAILASASLFTKNIYQSIIRKKASDKELVWATRVIMFVFTALGAVLAITVNSIYVLYILAVDLVYTIVFPQFVSVLWLDPNTYGSVVSLVVTIIVRIGVGEPLLDFAGFINLPSTEYPDLHFPVKTFVMLLNLAILLVVSYLVRYLFASGKIPENYDFLKCNLAHGGRSYLNDGGDSNGNGLELSEGRENAGYISDQKMDAQNSTPV